MFQVLLLCDQSVMVRAIYFFKTFLNILRFSLPLILIFMLTIDFYKGMIIGENDDKQQIIKKVGNRVIACIIVFLVPTIVNLTMSIINKAGYGNGNYFQEFASCYDEASLELVKKLESEEDLKLSEIEEQKRQESIILAADYQAKEAAKKEENRKAYQDSQSGVSPNGSYSSNLTDLNKQNGVYIKNGTFYKPSGPSGKGCPGSNATSKGYNNSYGYNNYFYIMLTNLIKGAKDAGYNLSISSQGCRSYKTQVEYYQSMEKGRAAKPGNSRHGWGIASDVTFYKNATTKCGSKRTRSNCPGMAWVHDNAYKYGLKFPLLNASYREDWHIEPINLKTY